MTIASILAVISGESGSRAALAVAFQLARRADAYLEVLHVSPDPNESVPLVGEGMSAAMVEQIMRELEESAKRGREAARAAYEAACAEVEQAPVEADGTRAPQRFLAAWRQAVGREDRETARRALLFDLVVVERAASEAEGLYDPALEAALFESGRPVLVVPPKPPARLGERVVIAWNGSAVAARAASAALPLLAGAREVAVISLAEGRGEADPAALAAYLAGHGIEAEARSLSAGTSAGETLLAEAARREADLLVMGAYGHSRLREFVLGGATRTVLSQAEIPVLMAH